MWNKTKIADAMAQRTSARVALDALARVSNDTRVLSCVIEDISSSGARLRLEDDAAVHLFGPGWHLSSTLIRTLPIEIRWRNVDHAGVTFEIDQEERAQLNRLVKALIRYGATQSGYHDGAEQRVVPSRPRHPSTRVDEVSGRIPFTKGG